jgi:hypothetical protein
MARPPKRKQRPKGFSLNDLVDRMILTEQTRKITKKMLVRPETLKSLKRPKKRRKK